MLSKKMETALNKQISLEAYASFLYLAMASWCDSQGFEGATAFMHNQSEEEREHMLRIFHYISEVDGYALTPKIAQPPHDYSTIQEMFAKVYAHEQKVTKSIHDLVALSVKEKDHTTYNFLQWYVEEQREEENLMRTILDKIKLIGDGPQSLYFIDQEVTKIHAAQLKAEAAKAGA